ncbi:PRTRC system ThiF family protein (plasmid) [Flagellatimonas centrodinii]|uniref:PRTRC system ThiF family protein n=1 Tax=Flagellatimonas centrodinii TaxID=2806210 RepID=UPI001FEECFFD|nr:PRTRC system ThiF family protein [Flagellatimonas centrodinii]ULQ48399.1 PRTRC system ThiF family protein [Flagellatimonas centrodinii]
MSTATFSAPSSWMERAIKVDLVGCGGTGSEVADALARLHLVLLALGHPRGLSVRLWDGDVVSESNVGRQRFYPSDVGYNKAEVLAARFNVGFGLNWCARPEFATPRLLDGAFSPGQDLLVTCVDRASVRVEIGEYFRCKRAKGAVPDQTAREVMWLDFGNGAVTGQVILGHLLTWKDSTGTRLPNVVNLFPGLPDVDDDAEPSCSLAAALRAQEFGINACVAQAGISSVLTPLLTKDRIGHHGVFVDIAAGQWSPLQIDPAAWDFMQGGSDSSNGVKRRRRKRPR